MVRGSVLLTALAMAWPAFAQPVTIDDCQWIADARERNRCQNVFGGSRQPPRSAPKQGADTAVQSVDKSALQRAKEAHAEGRKRDAEAARRAVADKCPKLYPPTGKNQQCVTEGGGIRDEVLYAPDQTVIERILKIDDAFDGNAVTLRARALVMMIMVIHAGSAAGSDRDRVFDAIVAKAGSGASQSLGEYNWMAVRNGASLTVRAVRPRNSLVRN